jgi:hypothetical protein
MSLVIVALEVIRRKKAMVATPVVNHKAAFAVGA